MSHRVDNIWYCWQYYAHQSTLTFLSRLSFVLQTGSWGKRCKLMTRYTFSFAREFYPYFFSGQGWRLLGQGDWEGEGHGCRAPAEQEPRRIIPLLFIMASLPSIYIGQCCQWSDPRLKAFKLCIHYVLIIPNTNQGISWNPFETASQRWNQIKSCMFLIATTMLHQLLGQYQCHSLAWYDITLLLARSFTTRSRLLINCRYIFMCYSS